MGFPIVRTAAGVLFVAAAVVSGVSFINSKTSYDKYEKSYDEMKNGLLATVPQLPEEVIKDNEYVVYDDVNKSVISSKSSYKNTYLFEASDAIIDLDSGEPEFVAFGDTSWEVANGFKKGGSITYKITTATYGMTDIDVYLGLGEIKNIPIDNLIDFITIKINGITVTTVNFDLPSDGSLQQLVLKRTNLIKGENTLEFATSVGDGSSANNFIMPAIAAVTFITDATIAQSLGYLINQGRHSTLLFCFIQVILYLFALYFSLKLNLGLHEKVRVIDLYP